VAVMIITDGSSQRRCGGCEPVVLIGGGNR
jgi:hypothetical protein